MKLVLDTADAKAIARINDYLTLDGVTTNPTIITKSGKSPEEAIQDIIDILSEDQKLFVQAVSTDVEGIVKEAEWIHNLRGGKNNYVKIPVTRNGLKAIKECKKRGYNVLATAIYSCEQGFLAALNGADCLAPYVNRMCNSKNGMQDVMDLDKILKDNNFDCYIVAASFKNVMQAHELYTAGIECCTLPVDVVDNMVDNILTTNAVEEFNVNWEKAYGRNTLL